MGCLVQGNRLNQAEGPEFHVMRDGDTSDPYARPLHPIGLTVHGSYFSFSLVFGKVSRLSQEKPLV